jgi:hypothetical protein
MKTEKIKITADIKSNIEIGSILVREVDAADEHRSDHLYKSLRLLLLCFHSVLFLLFSCI